MKKISQTLCIFLSIWGFSQCNLKGSASLDVGETAMYSLPKEVAQCKHCFQWSAGNSAVLMSDSRLNSVELKAENAGKTTLAVEYLSDGGLVKCTKDIEVAHKSEVPAAKPQKNGECDIDVKDYKDVKISENRVAFYPNSNQALNYEWVVNYKDGHQVKSTQKSPQFNYTLENPIVKVELKVASTSCYKRFTRPYVGDFWKYFK